MFLFFVIALLPKEAYHDLAVGGRPLALGYAVTAQNAHPTSIFFNPASLSVVEEGMVVTHYQGVGWDSLGRVTGLSLILPDLCLTYLPLTKVRRFDSSVTSGRQQWLDERYKVDEYIVTVTSRTANTSFTEREPLLIGANIKYLRGSYTEIEWARRDSLWEKPKYVISDGGGYGFDLGVMLRVEYLQFGVMLKDIYSRMKWHEGPHGDETDKIDFIPRFGGSLNLDKAGILFDVQKTGNDITFHLGGEVKWKFGEIVFGPRGGMILQDGKDNRYMVGGGIAYRTLFVDFGYEPKSKDNALSLGAGM